MTESGTGRRIFYGWVIVAAAFPVATISYGCLYSFGVFLIPLRDSFGASSAAISGAYSMTILLYMAAGIPFGWLSDKYGPKVTTIGGGLIMGVGLLLTSRVTTVWQLYLTYALVGVGMAPSYGPLMATVSRWFTKRRGLALGIYTAGVGVGPLITAPLASRLILAYDWRLAYVVLASSLALNIPAAFLLKKSPQEIGEVPDGLGHGGAAPSPAAPASGGVPDKPLGLSLKEALRTPAFWQLATVYFMIGVSLQMVMAHVVAYGVGKDVPSLTAAALLSTVSGMSIAGRVLMGTYSDVIGRRRALAMCVLGEGILVLALTQASAVWTFFLFAVMFGFFYGGHVPQLPALVGETMGLANVGILLGSTSFFWGIGGAIGPPLAGWVVDVTGGYVWAFVAGGCGLLFAAAIAISIKRP